MTRPDEALIAHLRELLEPLGRFAARAMFGGWGVYLDAIIIGIVDEGRFYLKVDAASEPRFVAAGSEPFVYMTRDGPMTMSYWSAPDEVLEASELMAPWARLALEAALRKRASAKPAKKVKTTQPATDRKQAKAAKPAEGRAKKTVAGAGSGATTATRKAATRKTIAASMAAKAKRTTGARGKR